VIEGLRDLADIDHGRFMDYALEEARHAGERGDRPIGAVIIHGGKVIARSSSTYYTNKSAVHHAENTAIMGCSRYLKDHGPDCVIYTTLEPCLMCLPTIVMANIRNIVFGLEDIYMRSREELGGVPWIRDRIFNYIGGVRRAESIALVESYCTERDRRTILEGIRT